MDDALTHCQHSTPKMVVFYNRHDRRYTIEAVCLDCHTTIRSRTYNAEQIEALPAQKRYLMQDLIQRFQVAKDG